MLALWRTTIGKKTVMAVTGLVLAGFVLSHMAGNLKLYFGREKYNAYAEFLREMGAPLLPHSVALWGMRLVLLGALALHLVAAVDLARSSVAGRPTKYTFKRNAAQGYAAFAMRATGVVVLLFAIFHLLHLTWGKVGLGGHAFDPKDVYQNVVNGFSQPLVAGFYIVSQLVLGVHLNHGIWSLFQTLGIHRRASERCFRRAALGFTVLVCGGNISFPIAVLTGWVK